MFKEKGSKFRLGYLKGMFTQNIVYDLHQKADGSDPTVTESTKKAKALQLLNLENVRLDGVFGLGLYERQRSLPFFNFNNTIIMMQIFGGNQDKQFLFLQKGNLMDYIDLTLTKV